MQFLEKGLLYDLLNSVQWKLDGKVPGPWSPHSMEATPTSSLKSCIFCRSACQRPVMCCTNVARSPHLCELQINSNSVMSFDFWHPCASAHTSCAFQWYPCCNQYLPLLCLRNCRQSREVYWSSGMLASLPSIVPLTTGAPLKAPHVYCSCKS